MAILDLCLARLRHRCLLRLHDRYVIISLSMSKLSAEPLIGRIGATYHIGFPVVTRASFGTWGSLWPVFNRSAMACVWYGVQVSASQMKQSSFHHDSK